MADLRGDSVGREQSAEAFPAQDGTVPRRGLFRLDGRVVIDAGMGPPQIVVLD